MGTFKIRITQVYKATRVCEVDVYAIDSESALEEIASGSIDTPEFDDSQWETMWDLQDQWETFS